MSRGGGPLPDMDCFGPGGSRTTVRWWPPVLDCGCLAACGLLWGGPALGVFRLWRPVPGGLRPGLRCAARVGSPCGAGLRTGLHADAPDWGAVRARTPCGPLWSARTSPRRLHGDGEVPEVVHRDFDEDVEGDAWQDPGRRGIDTAEKETPVPPLSAGSDAFPRGAWWCRGVLWRASLGPATGSPGAVGVAGGLL